MPAPIVIRNLTPETKKPANPGPDDPLIATKAELRDGSRGAGTYSGPAAEPDGSLIFDADFDNQPDWMPDFGSQRYRYDGDTYMDGDGFVAGDNTPPGFDYYYMSEKWHPADSSHADKQPVAQISSLHGSRLDPANGKSFIMYDESYGSASQWGADSVMTKDLGQEYQEFWVELWIRFQPNFLWQSILNGSGMTSMKLFRCRRHTGSVDPSRFAFYGAASRSGSPVCIMDLQQWTSSPTHIRSRVLTFVRGYTLAEDYGTADDYYQMGDYPNNMGDYITLGGSNNLGWDETFGDAEWHKINYHLKMDSFAGAGDGIAETFIDDVLTAGYYDVPWRQAGDPENIGWNEISLGGNMNNVWADKADRAEQWYQVSEFKIWNGEPM